jgi:hypothetical protein
VKKDVILVTAYTPDDLRMQYLVDLIYFLSENNKDIILISHSPNIPEIIIKKCKYFTYSSENKLIDLEEIRFFSTRETEFLSFGSKYMYPFVPSTFLAIYNMIYLGSVIAKSLQYDILHYVEYDCDFDNINLINYSNQKLSEDFDSLIIVDDQNNMHGGFFSYNLNSFEFYDFIFDEDKMIRELKNVIITENFTRQCFLKNKKIFEIYYNQLDELGYKKTKYGRIRKNMPYVFPVLLEGRIKVIHDNWNPINEDLVIILNDEKVFKVKTHTGNYNLVDISKVEDVKKLTIIINDNIEKIYDFEDEQNKKIILSNSYLYFKN